MRSFGSLWTVMDHHSLVNEWGNTAIIHKQSNISRNIHTMILSSLQSTVYLCNFCPFLLRNSSSSTVQTEPFLPSTRTKHLWRLRLCRTAFYTQRSKRIMHSLFYMKLDLIRDSLGLPQHKTTARSSLCHWRSSCEIFMVCKREDVGFRIGLFVGSESWNDKCALYKYCISYLPCGSVVTEVEERAGKPVIDFI